MSTIGVWRIQYRQILETFAGYCKNLPIENENAFQFMSVLNFQFSIAICEFNYVYYVQERTCDCTYIVVETLDARVTLMIFAHVCTWKFHKLHLPIRSSKYHMQHINNAASWFNVKPNDICALTTLDIAISIEFFSHHNLFCIAK